MNRVTAIEYCLLESTTLLPDMERLCQEAVERKYAAVCVPPMFVKQAKLLSGASVKVATVVGFPLGYNAIEAKLSELVLAIVDGVDEINFVINLLALKNGDWQYLAKELNMAMAIINKSEKVIKIVLECGLLNRDEMVKCCDLYGVAGVNFILLNTGSAGIQPKIDDLHFVRKHLADPVKIAMYHGNADVDLIQDWLNAGIDRLLVNQE